MTNSDQDFSKKLILWYLDHKRDLPWRKTTAPYYIWLSEIILQQTRVAQGLPYYLKFISAFPTVEELATAKEDTVLKLWQGLGYYSRARNLHFTAKEIVSKYNGKFPTTYKELLTLKGVGDYTASAIASICYKEPAAVVDGNVYRVLSRYFGIDTPINGSRAFKEFKTLAQNLIVKSQPGTFNQAIMEFGATYCVPQNPDCGNCIFNDSCVANKLDQVNKLPVKNSGPKIKKRYFNYIVILNEDESTVLNQRTGSGIWQQLFEFPLIESTRKLKLNELLKHPDFIDLKDKWFLDEPALYNGKPIVHKLSHQHLYTHFWIVNSAKVNSQKVLIENINRYAMPKLMENFVSEFSLFNKLKK